MSSRRQAMYKLQSAWLLKMAWRDSRSNFARLFLFISSIVIGIAALVAIYSFGANLKRDIDQQAATLLGADLMISGNKVPDADLKNELGHLNAERSEERSFASMLRFQKGTGARLVQIRAIQGVYPYYGTLETTPAEAGGSFRSQEKALVDRTLMIQYHVNAGDTILVGNAKFAIAGSLNNSPGQTGFSSTIAPAVFIPLSALDKTGLIKTGSRVRYSYYFKFKKQYKIESFLKTIDPLLDKGGFKTETIESKKNSTGKSFGDLTRFLSLVGFIALLLGCIGVASSIHIYIREKMASIAILRCLGVRSEQAFLIYLIQVGLIGLLGSVAGAMLGALLQQILPVVFRDFLPVSISTNISWLSIGEGIILGLFVSLLFALSSLLAIRSVSPLNTLRVSSEEKTNWKDPLRLFNFLLILLFIFGFTWLQLESLAQALFFVIGIMLAFGLLALTATLLMRLVRASSGTSWPYVWRQGFSNLYRPNNQTLILVISIGLGTAFICILLFIQTILIRRVTLSTAGNKPNIILFDIQSDQESKIARLTRQSGLPVLQQVPIVTMRLEEVNGKTAAALKKDSIGKPPHEAFSREYRVTYRDHLTESERIVRGNFTGFVAKNDTPRISLADDFAEHNHFHIGDLLLFNVQGLSLITRVGSLRSIDWNGIQTNFQVIFPKGVLEDAPASHVLMSRINGSGQSASFQQRVLKEFPTVSIIDIRLILSVLDELLRKIDFVIRFMSGFSMLTGLIVLIASVRISKYQRIQESVLLRTLGASRFQILAITSIEYFFLGALASLTGILLALAGSWLLARYSFKVSYGVELLPVLLVFLLVTGLTILIGLLNSAGILSRPPLEVLRKEV